MTISFVDIHCHLVPGIDDGAKDWDESLAMARMAAADGTSTIIATPHQLGSFGENRGETIRAQVAELQARLDAAELPLNVLPGADVRIEPNMFDGLAARDVLTLGDHGRHVLLELPHDLYLPLEPVLAELERRRIVGILSHPERNEGILRKPEIIPSLVECGCLLQITAGSLCGSFGPQCQEMAEWLLIDGYVHFIATDAHGTRSRRPLMSRAFERVAELTDESIAEELCSGNPGAVVQGQAVRPGRRASFRRKRKWVATKSVA